MRLEVLQPRTHASGDPSTEAERSERCDRSGDREAACARQGEAQEHDVPGHVRHEDVAKDQMG